jgi:hypothetical protein
MKRVLVVCWSQTGQLKACAESLVAPLKASGDVQVDFVEPAPREDYPFPWGMRGFLSVFCESVLMKPAPLKPIALDPSARYDLIVLAYQVWYLSPAPPTVAFLRSDAAKVLEGTPIVALCACRNMWHQGWKELKKLIAAQGGKVIDHLVLVDSGPAWATFYTTPRWLIAGRKEGGPFPPAGVSQADIAGLAPAGEKLLAAVREGRLDRSVYRGSGLKVIEVDRKFLIPELAVKPLFRLWAGAIEAISTRAPSLRYPLGLAWFGWLISVLPLIPACALVGLGSRVAFPGWYRARIQELSSPSGGEEA